jgi:beta-glucuronidase
VEPGAAYLYTLEARVEKDGGVVDRYPLEVGIRTVEVKDSAFLINGKPFYFKGFGKHEDMDVKGRGLDHAMLVRDFNLLEWIGANSFRTSHYPYAEEVMRMADRRGIVIVDEAPAVGMNMFRDNEKIFSEERVNDETRAHHIRVVEELIARDKNHPSVVMWSVGNEPASGEDGAPEYFGPVFARARELDPTRPVTCVEVVDPGQNKNAHLSDVILVNRYDSWYWHQGKLQVVERTLEEGLTKWYESFGKPVIISEYGADTIAGMHRLPATMFSEEYQREFMKRFHAAFDRLPFVIGEHMWNFADFGTKQGVTRVGGNKKGIFTRRRQPKGVAFDIRDRWLSRHDKW